MVNFKINEFFSGKNILVTGGSGFVGTNLIIKLSKLDVKITATFLNKKPDIDIKNVHFVQSDLTDISNCKKIVKNIDYVFMCAANTSGAKVMATQPLVHLTPNVIMNMNMLESAYKAKIKKFLFISSNTVYPLTDFAVQENDVTNEFYKSYHIVAWMKRFTEIVCDMYTNRIADPMKTVIIRPGNLYGPYDKFDKEKSKVIPALIRRAFEKQDPFVVWGDGKDLKDFLYIDDFIELLVKLIYDEKKETNLYNVASGTPITIKQILDLIIQILGKNNLTINYDTTKPTMIPIRKINIDKVQKETNWYPKVSMKEGLKNTISWYKNAYKENKPEELN